MKQQVENSQPVHVPQSFKILFEFFHSNPRLAPHDYIRITVYKYGSMVLLTSLIRASLHHIPSGGLRCAT